MNILSAGIPFKSSAWVNLPRIKRGLLSSALPNTRKFEWKTGAYSEPGGPKSRQLPRLRFQPLLAPQDHALDRTSLLHRRYLHRNRAIASTQSKTAAIEQLTINFMTTTIGNLKTVTYLDNRFLRRRKSIDQQTQALGSNLREVTKEQSCCQERQGRIPHNPEKPHVVTRAESLANFDAQLNQWAIPDLLIEGLNFPTKIDTAIC